MLGLWEGEKRQVQRNTVFSVKEGLWVARLTVDDFSAVWHDCGHSSPSWKLPEPASLTLFLLTADSCRGQQGNQFLGYPPRWARSVLNSSLSGNLIFYSDLLPSLILRLALKSTSPLQFDSPQHLLSTFTPNLTRALPSHTDVLGGRTAISQL